jgi:DNA-binding SARP family transcriptional activator/TolB-like protein/Tfp pilus assembly protein PilF
VITLRTLGSLDLRTERSEEPLSSLAHGKRVALLSYLAVARPRGFHRRDTIIGLFWPEVDQSHARAALRQAVHFLRQTLGPDVVLSRGAQDIGLDFARITCDAIEFQVALERGEFEQAASMYGGPLLHGLYVSEAPEFERWVNSERDRLAQLYADALRSLALAAAERGDHSGSARWWKQLAVADPYSPEIAYQLMSALDAAGDRAAAIEHAELHAAAMRNGFDIEPDAGVLEFAARLRTEPPRRAVVPAAVPRQSEVQQPAPGTGSQPAVGPGPRSHQRRTLFALGGVLVAIVSLVVFVTGQRQTVAESWSRVSVGVLPFGNIGFPEYDYFAAGLTEDVVHRLAGVQILSVLGPNEGALRTFDDREGSEDAALGADYTLRATVERVRGVGGTESIRLRPSLFRSTDGVEIWSETIDRDLASLFDMQAFLAEEITRVLGIPLMSTERDWLTAQPTQDLHAYDLYLRANQYLREDTSSETDLSRAVALLDSATALDTAFVQAHAMLAIAHTSMFVSSQDRSPGRLIAAREAADRAMRMRPDAPMSHLAFGWYYYLGLHNYDRALRHFELARAVWPGVSDLLVQLGDIRRRQGDLEQALKDHLEAERAAPRCATCAAETAVTYLMMRNFTAAEREAERALEIAPDLAHARCAGGLARISAGQDPRLARQMVPPPEDPQALVELAAGRWGAIPRILGGQYDAVLEDLTLSPAISDTAGFYLVKAELTARHDQAALARDYYDSARVRLESLTQQQPDDALLRGRLGLAYAGLGWKDAAIREGLEATRLRPTSDDLIDGAVASELLARIYAMVGEADAAISRLEVLLSGPSLLSSELLRLDPIWAPLADNPRFQRMTL